MCLVYSLTLDAYARLIIDWSIEISVRGYTTMTGSCVMTDGRDGCDGEALRHITIN